MAFRKRQLLNINKKEIEDKSITHLEIYYALKDLLDSESVSLKNSFFYFRTITNECDIIPKHYYDGQCEQKKLKDWIVEKMGVDYADHITPYEAQWDYTNNKILEASLEKLSSVIYAQLESNILEELEQYQDEKSADDETDYYLTLKNENSILRDETKQIIDSINSNSEQILILQGESGSGKSTIIAQVFDNLTRQNGSEEVYVLSYIVGLNSDSNEIIHMLDNYNNRLNCLLESIKGMNSNCEIMTVNDTQNTSSLKDCIKKFSLLLSAVCEYRKLVILIDNLDELENIGLVKNLSWLPERLPRNLKVVVSTVPDYIWKNESNKVKIIYINGMNMEQIRTMLISNAFLLYGKSWNPDALLKVQTKIYEEENLPLYGEVLSSYVMNLSMVDFNRFTTMNQYWLWIQNVITQLPSSVEELYQIFIQKAREDYGKEKIDAIIGLITISRNGLFENDLSDAVFEASGIRLSSIELLSIRGFFAGHLRADMQLEWWNFEHNQLRECIYFLMNCNEMTYNESELHKAIIKATESKKYTGYLLTEYILHSYYCNDLHSTVHWYNNIPEDLELTNHAKLLALFDIISICEDNEKYKWLENVLDLELQMYDEKLTLLLALMSYCYYTDNNYLSDANYIALLELIRNFILSNSKPIRKAVSNDHSLYVIGTTLTNKIICRCQLTNNIDIELKYLTDFKYQNILMKADNPHLYYIIYPFVRLIENKQLDYMRIYEIYKLQENYELANEYRRRYGKGTRKIFSRVILKIIRLPRLRIIIDQAGRYLEKNDKEKAKNELTDSVKLILRISDFYITIVPQLSDLVVMRQILITSGNTNTTFYYLIYSN